MVGCPHMEGGAGRAGPSWGTGGRLTENPAVLRGHGEAAPVSSPQQSLQGLLQLLLQGRHLPFRARGPRVQGRGRQQGARVLGVLQPGCGVDVQQLLKGALTPGGPVTYGKRCSEGGRRT